MTYRRPRNQSLIVNPNRSFSQEVKRNARKHKTGLTLEELKKR